MTNRISVWVRNHVLLLPEHLMQRYLERRGWCVFYLEPRARYCPHNPSTFDCWLKLYEATKEFK